MFMFHFIRKSLKTAKHHPRLGGLEILKYIGPGLLVTVGFIDPGNWASNLAAGADYGYTLLWMVSLSTVMLIILQHNVAHLGIATGLCLSEATMTYIRPKYDIVDGYGSFGVHLPGRNFGRSDRFGNVVRYSGADRSYIDYRFRMYYAFY